MQPWWLRRSQRLLDPGQTTAQVASPPALRPSSAGKKKRADGEAVPAPGPSSAKVAKSVKIELAEPVIKKMKAEPTEEATKPARPQGRKRRAP